MQINTHINVCVGVCVCVVILSISPLKKLRRDLMLQLHPAVTDITDEFGIFISIYTNIYLYSNLIHASQLGL